MKGTQLCSRFSRITNQLNYCGPSEAHKTFAEHIKTGIKEEETRNMLSKFEGLYPYLRFIAKKHSLDPFDFKVVEAYWIGNELLDIFTREDYQEFLSDLGKAGLPERYVQESRKRMPANAIPHHTFHVLFVGVGRVTQSVPTNLESMQNCMASWGEVLGVHDGAVRVKGPFLKAENGKFILSITERSTKYNPNLIQPKIGDWVAMHWGECAHILTKTQLENLQKYTNRVIESVNSAPSSS